MCVCVCVYVSVFNGIIEYNGLDVWGFWQPDTLKQSWMWEREGERSREKEKNGIGARPTKWMWMPVFLTTPFFCMYSLVGSFGWLESARGLVLCAFACQWIMSQPTNDWIEVAPLSHIHTHIHFYHPFERHQHYDIMNECEHCESALSTWMAPLFIIITITIIIFFFYTTTTGKPVDILRCNIQTCPCSSLLSQRRFNSSHVWGAHKEVVFQLCTASATTTTNRMV